MALPPRLHLYLVGSLHPKLSFAFLLHPRADLELDPQRCNLCHVSFRIGGASETTRLSGSQRAQLAPHACCWLLLETSLVIARTTAMMWLAAYGNETADQWLTVSTVR